MRDGPFSFAACCAAAGTPRRTDPIGDDLEDAWVLREALYDLLHLHAMEEVGQAHLDQCERWRKAWARAAEVYGEEGPAS